MLSTSQDYHYYSWIKDTLIVWSTNDSILGMCQFLSLVRLGFVIGLKKNNNKTKQNDKI